MRRVAPLMNRSFRGGQSETQVTKMQLQPQLFNLNNLLNGRLFRIPEYQRAYSWEKKQRADLFGDIERVRASNEDHFMATIVGLTRGQKQIVADQFSVIEVVDGQQRL